MQGIFKDNIINIGFTGSRKGIKDFQRVTLEKTLIKLFLEQKGNFHNGVCIGSDEESWNIVKLIKNISLIAHPPTDNSLTFDYSDAYVVKSPKPYLKRNMQIVAESDLLIATPESVYESVRSGTWATIRYARIARIPILIIFPNGSIRQEKPETIE